MWTVWPTPRCRACTWQTCRCTRQPSREEARRQVGYLLAPFWRGHIEQGAGQEGRSRRAIKERLASWPSLREMRISVLAKFGKRLQSSLTQVVAAGRRKFFYQLDLAGGRVERVAGLFGRDEKSLETFVASHDQDRPGDDKLQEGGTACQCGVGPKLAGSSGLSGLLKDSCTADECGMCESNWNSSVTQLLSQ